MSSLTLQDSDNRAVRVRLSRQFDSCGSHISNFVHPCNLGISYDQFQRFVPQPANCLLQRDRKALPSHLLLAHLLVSYQLVLLSQV